MSGCVCVKSSAAAHVLTRLPTHHAWDCVPARTSARRVITQLCAASTVQLTAASHGRWNALLAIPEGLLGRVEKNEGGETWQRLLWFHIPGNFDLQQRNQNKNPLLAAKPAQQEDGVAEERWREGEQWSLSLWLQMGAFLTAQSFCSAKIRGHCCALRGCQTLKVSQADAPRRGSISQSGGSSTTEEMWWGINSRQCHVLPLGWAFIPANTQCTRSAACTHTQQRIQFRCPDALRVIKSTS